MNRTIKSVLFWLVIVAAAMILWKAVNTQRTEQAVREISYSEFLSLVEAGNVSKVTITKEQITGSYRNGEAFRLHGPENPDAMVQMLRQKNVEVWFGKEEKPSQWLLNLLPLVLLVGLWAVMMRQMKLRRQQGNQAGPPPPIG